jgi:hypothetical protein
MANPLYGQNKADELLDDYSNGLRSIGRTLPLAADSTLTSDDSGKIIFVDATGAAGEVDIALPAPSAGLYFKFICTEDTPSHDVKIVATGTIVYGIIMVQSDTNEDNSVVAAGSTNVLFDTTCKKGDWVEFVSDGTSWFIKGMGTVQGAFTVS